MDFGNLSSPLFYIELIVISLLVGAFCFYFLKQIRNINWTTTLITSGIIIVVFIFTAGVWVTIYINVALIVIIENGIIILQRVLGFF